MTVLAVSGNCASSILSPGCGVLLLLCESEFYLLFSMFWLLLSSFSCLLSNSSRLNVIICSFSTDFE